LYRGVSASVQPQSDLLLPSAFKELGTAAEELQVAAEQLLEQTEELAATRAEVESQRQRYKDLFDFMPNAYLVTDVHGKIQEANRAAAALLNVEQSLLVGKLLVSFIPIQERSVFRSQLNQLLQRDWVQEWTGILQPNNSKLFDAALSVAPVRDSEGNPVSLRWIVHDITVAKRAQKALLINDYDPSQDRPRHFYAKAEIIPLGSSDIWLVCRGLVKLTTMNETGEEVLVGLAGPSMLFGSSLTSLPTYQAIALSQDTELVCISLSELATSPALAQALLPHISKRLRQTEALLAISGKRQVKERLNYLLLWLEQEIGQTVAQGTRLSVRLTHQELADACCTTRVTITRLLSSFQKQGKITFDSEHRMILLREVSQQKCS
jgi:PAS domain S-box-containing protein